jgi:predicted small lipoprotein YifL
LLLIAALILLGGCGQKGPLYLPDEEQQEDNRG